MNYKKALSRAFIIRNTLLRTVRVGTIDISMHEGEYIIWLKKDNFEMQRKISVYSMIEMPLHLHIQHIAGDWTHRIVQQDFKDNG